MIGKLLVTIFLCYQAFALPLTVNFQMVVKDDFGRPIQFQDENITFHMKGNVTVFWSETKNFTAPNGIITTMLGRLVPIDPVSFYAQDSVRLIVTRGNGDTVLSEPFNTVPYAFRAGLADSARNTYSFQGRLPSDFLPDTFEVTIKKMISDSVATHDPGQRISDTVSAVKVVLRQEARDTAIVLRGYIDTQAALLRTNVRGDIRDSIAAHPANLVIGDSIVFVGQSGWNGNGDSVTLALGNSKSFLRNRYLNSLPFDFHTEKDLIVSADQSISINSTYNLALTSGSNYISLSGLRVGGTTSPAWVDSINISFTRDTLLFYVGGSAIPFKICK